MMNSEKENSSSAYLVMDISSDQVRVLVNAGRHEICDSYSPLIGYFPNSQQGSVSKDHGYDKDFVLELENRKIVFGDHAYSCPAVWLYGFNWTDELWRKGKENSFFRKDLTEFLYYNIKFHEKKICSLFQGEKSDKIDLSIAIGLPAEYFLNRKITRKLVETKQLLLGKLAEENGNVCNGFRLNRVIWFVPSLLAKVVDYVLRNFEDFWKGYPAIFSFFDFEPFFLSAVSAYVEEKDISGIHFFQFKTFRDINFDFLKELLITRYKHSNLLIDHKAFCNNLEKTDIVSLMKKEKDLCKMVIDTVGPYITKLCDIVALYNRQLREIVGRDTDFFVIISGKLGVLNEFLLRQSGKADVFFKGSNLVLDTDLYRAVNGLVFAVKNNIEKGGVG